jgi:hypothetical protein
LVIVKKNGSYASLRSLVAGFHNSLLKNARLCLAREVDQNFCWLKQQVKRGHGDTPTESRKQIKRSFDTVLS